jgi:hypothetical protein
LVSLRPGIVGRTGSMARQPAPNWHAAKEEACTSRACADDGFTASHCGLSGTGFLNEAAGRHAVGSNTWIECLGMRSGSGKPRGRYHRGAVRSRKGRIGCGWRELLRSTGDERGLRLSHCGAVSFQSEKRGVQAAGNGPSEDRKCWQRVELGIHSLNRWTVKC